MFVEVESTEKADEICKAGLLWYTHAADTAQRYRPWGQYEENDCPTYWGKGAWSYYILLED